MNNNENDSETTILTENKSSPLSENEADDTGSAENPPKSWRQKISHRVKDLWSKANRPGSSESELSKEELFKRQQTIKDALSTIFSLVIPLSICFILCICILKNLPFFKDDQKITFYLTPLEEKVDSTAVIKFGTAIANSLIFISVVIVQTIIMVLLYKYKFYKVLYSFFFLSTLLLLFMSSMFILSQVIVYFNIPMDWITISVAVWNFAVVGLITIFSDHSRKLQNAYHILTTAFFSSIFAHSFPQWTAWVVMMVLVVWDLVAVLAPFGPLKMLVNLAQEREESIFASLIYKTMLEPKDLNNTDGSSLIKQSATAEVTQPKPSSTRQSKLDRQTKISNNSRTISPSPAQQPTETISNPTDSDGGNGRNSGNSGNNGNGESDENIEVVNKDGDNAQLGLGDFIFYSLLIGKTLMYDDWNVTISCYIAIIFGLMATFTILIIYAKALPALPLSLVFGLVFYFSTYFMVSPFFSYLTFNQILV